MAKDKKPFHESFAEKIIESLKAGTAPWQRPWEPGEYQSPFNPISGSVYSGVNQVALSAAGLNDPRFMTYKQAASKGWQIKKGAKSEKVVFWASGRPELIKDEGNKPILDENGKMQFEIIPFPKPVLRYASVFHASQIEGIPEWEGREVTWNPDERAEIVIGNSGASIIHDQHKRAFYRPSSDEIHLPPQAAFDSSDKYYSTALHELSHWTGHASRLDREGGPFGSELYAREELRAEIGSWMINSELGLGHDPSQHLSYVDSWVKVLEKDPYEIVRACRDADKIKKYTLDFEKQRSMEETKEQGMAMSGPDKARLEQRESMHGTPENGKTYLKVPFSEKEQAKKLGAKWDKEQKMWFAPEGANPDSFKKWLPRLAERIEVSIKKTGELIQSMTKDAEKKKQEKSQAKNPAQEKTYLNVPYKEKWQAKKLGARWDKSAKLWFAATGTDLDPLSKWLPKNKAITPAGNPEQEFAKAVQEAGLDLQGQLPIMDGTLQRIPVIEGKQNSKDGAYTGFLDGNPAGFIQNHKTGLKMNWKAEGHQLTDEQKAELKAQSAQKKQEREKLLAEQREKASKRSYAKWKNAKDWANDKQTYLAKKGVYGYGVKVNEHGNLIIPGRDVNGHIHTLQTVTEEAKLFEKGGLKSGSFHTIDPDQKIAQGGPILIAEGYATSASIHMATGEPTIVAFDASNLEPVAKALHEKYPDSPIIILGDNDHHLKNNVGVEKAEAAAIAVSGVAIVPKFSDSEREQGLSDFNDLHQSSGLDAVKKQLFGINKAPKKAAQNKNEEQALAI
ncbi:zincin-like metallopeptidase domain-containing protein [Maridesulfovibrio frigidus]|uniref:zincin-like metallopeptidase domain-containing protein n=1 Tax=Maridesulfovibrio frigidus TaxID=340956 RepID=UPI0004E13F35|nr:zincin-like metallopeptidase domain-containing protein [Maridesulfovibrio frigidus]